MGTVPAVPKEREGLSLSFRTLSPKKHHKNKFPIDIVGEWCYPSLNLPTGSVTETKGGCDHVDGAQGSRGSGLSVSNAVFPGICRGLGVFAYVFASDCSALKYSGSHLCPGAKKRLPAFCFRGTPEKGTPGKGTIGTVPTVPPGTKGSVPIVPYHLLKGLSPSFRTSCRLICPHRSVPATKVLLHLETEIHP